MKKILLILAFILVLPALSYADAGDNVSGYAWSWNTGWIKMNSCENNNCDPVAYGVNINSNGAFEGYGWSSNVGWVDFSGGSCGAGAQATFAGNGSATISGWIQAVSAAQAGNNSGGWNGCIRMSGPITGGGNYGVTIGGGASPQQFSGYAWNANNSGTTVGESWIDFSGVKYVKEDSFIDLSIDHWNNTCTPTNNKINLTWETEGITPGSCQWTSELSGSAGDNGNNQLFNLGAPQSNYNITLKCGSPTGDITDTVSVSCDPLNQCEDGVDNDNDGNTDTADMSCHAPCPAPQSTQNTYLPTFNNESHVYGAIWTTQHCASCTINTTYQQNSSCYCSYHPSSSQCIPQPPGPLTAPKYEEL